MVCAFSLARDNAGKSKRGQNGDDRYDHQELDQGKPTLAGQAFFDRGSFVSGDLKLSAGCIHTSAEAPIRLVELSTRQI